MGRVLIHFRIVEGRKWEVFSCISNSLSLCKKIRNMAKYKQFNNVVTGIVIFFVTFSTFFYIEIAYNLGGGKSNYYNG